jgi:hypothetical protein
MVVQLYLQRPDAPHSPAGLFGSDVPMGRMDGFGISRVSRLCCIAYPYLDLADAQWRIVQITAEGWRAVTDAPVKFRRARGMLPWHPTSATPCSDRAVSPALMARVRLRQPATAD